MKPEILAQLDERPRIGVLPDGTLMGFHVSREGNPREVRARTADDGGRTWSAAETIFALPESVPPQQIGPPPRLPNREPSAGSAPVGIDDDSSEDDPIGGWGGCEVLVDADGEIHLFLVNDRATGVMVDPALRGQVRSMEIHDRRLDVWHMRSFEGRRQWRAPRRIWKGYTGSINSVMQLRGGRIVLPFAMLTHRTWRDRGEGLDAFWFAGTSTTTAVFSDDGGETWQQSPADLKVQTPSIGTYGAVEPVVLELADGRAWMLIRTQVGRFYESFSADGAHWSPPRPSRLIASDSPAGLARLADGRMVLLWNKCLRFPYAHGGRHVLHAAVSEDEGKTWIGQREVARDPLRHEPPPPGGDHGTAYPFPAALADGRVLATTGQGKGRVVVVAIDPDWLYERRQATDFSAGLDGWEQFGCRGVELREHPDKEGARVLSIHRTHAEWLAAAVWNFPSGARGRLRLRICVQEGSAGAQMLLTDHFSVPFDPEDALHALFALEADPDGTLNSGGHLEVGCWHTLELRWDCAAGTCRVNIDGELAGALLLQRASEGANYLRLRSSSETVERGGLLVEEVDVEVEAANGTRAQ